MNLTEINDMKKIHNQFNKESDELTEQFKSICKKIDNCLKYQKGKIYKIVSNKTDKVYVGSTYTSLATRLGNHRRCQRYYVKYPDKIIRCTSFDIIELGDYRIELIENYPCYSRKQLQMREGYHMKRTDNLINRCIVGRSEKQYREDNKKQIKIRKQKYYQDNKVILQQHKREYYLKNKENINKKNRARYNTKKEVYKIQRKQYREKNKEKIQEKRKQTYVCVCGSVSTIIHKKRHEKTKKHQTYIQNQ